MQHVMIAGATGVIGQHLLQGLLSDPNIQSVHVLVRRPLVAVHPKQHIHVVDFEQLSHWSPDFCVDTAFSCLGTTLRTAGSQSAFRRVDHDAVLAFATLSQRLGASHFLSVSAIGANTRAVSFYSRVKGEVESALKAMNFPTLTLMRPSLLIGPRIEFRLAERIGQILSRPIAPLLRGSLNVYRPIGSHEVANAMLVTARHPKRWLNVLTWQQIKSLNN